jgi:hypothetical protein
MPASLMRDWQGMAVRETVGPRIAPTESPGTLRRGDATCPAIIPEPPPEPRSAVGVAGVAAR